MSIEAEKTLLCSCLTYADAHSQALAMGLSPEMFLVSDHQRIFRAVQELSETGQQVAADTVARQVGDVSTITALIIDLNSTMNMPRKDVSWHVKQIRTAWRRRALQYACDRTIKAIESDDDTDECFSSLSNQILEIEGQSSRQSGRMIGDILPQTWKTLRERAKNDGTTIGIPTGIAPLDRSTTGIRPGELWIVGALPGRGKTSLGIQIAAAAVEHDTPTAVFSLEMNAEEELGARLLAANSEVSAKKLRDPRHIDQNEWEGLASTCKRMKEWPLLIDDSPELNLTQLLARARLYKRQHGIKLVVVDYLRLVDAQGRELRERVSNVANGLRKLAKAEQIGVVALSQLARPKDGDINSRPTMLSFKESGDIEAHAHVALLLYQPVDNDQPTGEDEIIIGKNRHGALGSIKVVFDKQRLQFEDREVKHGQANGASAAGQAGAR